jgi:hypothetical protein
LIYKYSKLLNRKRSLAETHVGLRVKCPVFLNDLTKIGILVYKEMLTPKLNSMKICSPVLELMQAVNVTYLGVVCHKIEVPGPLGWRSS